MILITLPHRIRLRLIRSLRVRIIDQHHHPTPSLALQRPTNGRWANNPIAKTAQVQDSLTRPAQTRPVLGDQVGGHSSGGLFAGIAQPMRWVRQMPYPRPNLLLDCRYESGLPYTEKTRALAHQQRALWGLNFSWT